MSKIIIEDDTLTKAKEYTNLDSEIINAIKELLESIIDNPINDYETDWTYDLHKD